MWLQVVAARDQKWRVASDKSDLLSLLRQFRTKIGGGLSQGISKKNWDPLRILATGEGKGINIALLLPTTDLTDLRNLLVPFCH